VAQRVSGDHQYHSAETYVEAAATVPLPKEFNLRLHVGKSFMDDDYYDNVDYSVGVSRRFANGFMADLSYYAMDDKGEELYGSAGDPRVVLKVSKHFNLTR
jgi:uncharacterized protein (TIGR02001 family)